MSLLELKHQEELDNLNTTVENLQNVSKATLKWGGKAFLASLVEAKFKQMMKVYSEDRRDFKEIYDEFDAAVILGETKISSDDWNSMILFTQTHHTHSPRRNEIVHSIVPPFELANAANSSLSGIMTISAQRGFSALVASTIPK